MTHKHLLATLVQIEMYNLRNVCPFVYKLADCDFINRSNKYAQLVPITSVHPPLCNYENPQLHALCVSNIYFRNGYNEHVHLLSHIKSKYNVVVDAKCDITPVDWK